MRLVLPTRLARPRAAAPRVFLVGLLSVLALFCSLSAMGPARAQGGHLHHWTAGNPPQGTLQVKHLNGSLVTDTFPAKPCEVLILYVPSPSDGDRCDAAGCFFPGGSVNDGALIIDRWRDNGALGHFGSYNKLFYNDEFTGPADSVLYGNGAVTRYRVADDEVPEGNTAGVRIKIEYQFTNYTSQFGVDPPTWTGACEFLVKGTQCWVDPSRSSEAYSRLHCKDAGKTRIESSLIPQNGEVSFSVPITSWGYAGTTLGVALHYRSTRRIDPGLSFHHPWDPADLSDFDQGDAYSPRWSLSYAEWIEILDDRTALWNRADGSQMTFTALKDANGVQLEDALGNLLWECEEGPYTLTESGDSTSPQFTHDGSLTTREVPYGQFELKDAAGTTWTFDRVRWNTSDTPAYDGAYAIPYYRLGAVSDRFGRGVSVSWDDWGITAIADGAGRGVTLQHDSSTHLITSIQDPAGRTHVLDHGTGSEPKLIGVHVYGAGAPNRAVYDWSFGYGGTYSDLVTSKIMPDGKAIYYEYSPQANPRSGPGDWDGKMTRCYYWDDLENPTNPVLREITRNGTTVTYPGGDSYTWEYTADGEHVTGITRNATGAASHWAYDSMHHVSATWTDQESSLNPLVSYQYTYGGETGKQVTAVTTTDLLGNQADALFNDLSLPTRLRALAATGSGHADQEVDFIYDGGGALTDGKLTRVIQAAGTASEEIIDLAYADGNRPALPTSILDGVGAQSSASYFANGAPSSLTSPVNLLAPVGDADRAASVVTAGQTTTDELPTYVIDPSGHRVNVSFNAENLGSERLVVTLTFVADNATKKITLDGAGRIVKSVDERGITTLVDYGRGGQVLKVTENSTGTSRVTTYTYGSHGELTSFTPPIGASGTVTFEYNRYNPGTGTTPPTLASPAVYEGQVTRVLYPDGTSQYSGYNSSGEATWSFRPAAGYTTLLRDSLHRVYQVDYPSTPLFSGITVSRSFDEFGRVVQTSDGNGTSTFSYDDLNRLTSAAPAVGAGLTYQYVKDLTNARRINKVTLSGTGTYEFREDGKGRVNQVLNPFNQLTSRSFDPDGKLLKETKPNGTTTDYTYTTRDWLASIQHKLANGSVLDTFQYFYTNSAGTYDKAGRLQREVDAGGRTHAFTYSNYNELSAETHPDLGTGQNYYFDQNGNRTRRLRNGVNTYSGYDGQNKLLWSNATNTAPTSGQANPYRKYTYNTNGEPVSIEHRDAVGQPVKTELYDFDGMGKLRRIRDAATGTTLYAATYDGGGDRVTQTQGGVIHTFSYGAGLLRDDTATGSTTYTPGISQRAGAVDTYFHEDWLGSNRYLTDALGATAPTAYRFDAYGNTSASGGPDSTVLKFAGQHGYQSDVYGGLQQLGARVYDSTAGRFLNPDPIGFAGGANLYGYCANNPVGAVDPSGLTPWDDFKSGVGGAASWAWGGIQGGFVAVGQGFNAFGKGLFNGVMSLGARPKSMGAAHTIDESIPQSWGNLAGLRGRGQEISDGVEEAGGIIAGNLAMGAVMGAAAAAEGAACEAAGGSGTLALPGYGGANPWRGAPFSLVADKEMVLYRVWGGGSGLQGDFLTPVRPPTSSFARSMLALPPQNAAQWVSEVRVPAGTRMQVGTAAPAFGNPGGATQVQLLQRLPASAFGPGVGLAP
jgi:RHS repeat-associated protein